MRNNDKTNDRNLKIFIYNLTQLYRQKLNTKLEIKDKNLVSILKDILE